MSHASKPPGLFRRMLARDDRALPDAADLGTCIGLEFSLDQGNDSLLPGATPPQPRLNWVQRLTARARTTG